MRKLITMILLTATMAASAKDLDFKGVSIGGAFDKQEIIEKLGYTAKISGKVFNSMDCTVGICIGRTEVGQRMVPVITVSRNDADNSVGTIDFSFDEYEFLQLSEMLHSKFDKPAHIEHGMLINNFGVKFRQTIETWTSEGGTLTLTHYIDSESGLFKMQSSASKAKDSNLSKGKI